MAAVTRIRLSEATATVSQKPCWQALAWVVGGYHHCGNVYQCGNGIRTSTLGEAATFDGELMTRMVLAAHRWCVRFAIEQGGPNRIGITVHPRKPGEESLYERHPSLEDLRDRITKMIEIDQQEAPNGDAS